MNVGTRGSVCLAERAGGSVGQEMRAVEKDTCSAYFHLIGL